MISDGQFRYDRIHPDGLTGALLALEGVGDAAVILHGPTGCRGHHSAMSERAFPRDVIHERLNYAERFYFGQPRIPTTYLDGEDYIFGAKEKLQLAVQTILGKKPGLLAIVNSPSAALIGEDLRQCLTDAATNVPRVGIEMPALSQPLSDGYQQAVVAVLEALDLPPAAIRPKTVNLLGLSIGHHHWAGSVWELRRLLALCGIEVLCAPGAGSPTVDWRSIPRAACNVVVHSEYADRIANWLERRFSVPAVLPESGVPIGFDATEQWVIQAAGAVGADPSPALADIRERRRRVSYHMSRIAGIGTALKGTCFSVHTDASAALPLVRFLYGYLGMLPVSVETSTCRDTLQAERLKDFLAGVGCLDAWQVPWQTVEADFLFADGHQVNQRHAFGCAQGGIELMLPIGGYADFVQKPLLGAEGAVHLVERIVNAAPDFL